LACSAFEGHGYGEASMDIPALTQAAQALFSICAAVAAMELLAGEGGAARSFRSLCALAATLCALRVLVKLL